MATLQIDSCSRARGADALANSHYLGFSAAAKLNFADKEIALAAIAEHRHGVFEALAHAVE
jgi:hypothetical protein